MLWAMSGAPEPSAPQNELPLQPPPRSKARRWAPVIVGLILIVAAITFVASYNLYPVGKGTSTPATVCQGGAAAGNYHFSFVGGIPTVNNGINFNGTIPGPCVMVGNGSHVTVHYQVDAQSPLNHSWVLIPANGTATSLPAFPGAGFSNNTRFTGIPPGSSVVFSFWTNQSGSYKYICEVYGHYDAGMYGWFNVSNPQPSAIYGLGAGPSPQSLPSPAAGMRSLAVPERL